MPPTLPRKSLIEICPLAFPARVLTAVSFKLILVVDPRPNSVFTWDIEIAPLAGNAMFHLVLICYENHPSVRFLSDPLLAFSIEKTAFISIKFMPLPVVSWRA